MTPRKNELEMRAGGKFSWGGVSENPQPASSEQYAKARKALMRQWERAGGKVEDVSALTEVLLAIGDPKVEHMQCPTKRRGLMGIQSSEKPAPPPIEWVTPPIENAMCCRGHIRTRDNNRLRMRNGKISYQCKDCERVREENRGPRKPRCRQK